MLYRAFDKLMNGESGTEVIKYLRPHYKTNTLKKYAWTLKEWALEAGLRHPQYDDSGLRTYAHEEGVREFLNAPIKVKLYTQRCHAKTKSWSRGAERELAKLKLLPDNLKSLKVTEKELGNIQRGLRVARRARLHNVVRVHQGDQLLQLAQFTLENATVNNTLLEICVSLAIVSGRRETELLNQRSIFRPNGEWTVWFTGQLKKPPGVPPDAVAFSIPILVKPALFINGLGVLRQKQGGIHALGELTNEQVSALYNGCFKRERLERFMPILYKFHFTRTLYTKFVDHLFDHRFTYNALACAILGHQDVKESLDYCGATLEDIDHLKRSYGPLILPS
jgi:hypothetical protein